MKLIKSVVLAVVVAFMTITPVFAGDYITDAANALKDSPVYVAPGTEGTNKDTGGMLLGRLRSDDNIVLVMLPSEAMSGTDVNELVYQLSEKLGNSKIIGLSVGKEVIGFAPVLPAGVAADQMRRAKSVSNDPVTALGTFVQNIHLWLKSNPQPSATPEPSPTPRPTVPPVPLTTEQKQTRLLGSVSVLLGLLVVVGIVFRRKIVFAFSKRVRSLKQTRNRILKIYKDVRNVEDERVRHELYKACTGALNIVDTMIKDGSSQTYSEEKLPTLVSNMGTQVSSWIDYESGKHLLPEDILPKLKEVLLNYDNLFERVQEGSPGVTDLLSTIIESNNAMIETLGYIPERPEKE